LEGIEEGDENFVGAVSGGFTGRRLKTTNVA
jgi:hypothetical protein